MCGKHCMSEFPFSFSRSCLPWSVGATCNLALLLAEPTGFTLCRRGSSLSKPQPSVHRDPDLHSDQLFPGRSLEMIWADLFITLKSVLRLRDNPKRVHKQGRCKEKNTIFICIYEVTPCLS